MNELLNKLKGSKTIIVNALMFVLMIIDTITGYGWVSENSSLVVSIVTGVNAALRFVTTTPIFKNKA